MITMQELDAVKLLLEEPDEDAECRQHQEDVTCPRCGGVSQLTKRSAHHGGTMHLCGGVLESLTGGCGEQWWTPWRTLEGFKIWMARVADLCSTCGIALQENFDTGGYWIPRYEAGQRPVEAVGELIRKLRETEEG